MVSGHHYSSENTNKCEEKIWLTKITTWLSSVHTPFVSLKSVVLAWRTFSFIIKDPDEEVVNAVGLEARQPSLATVPTECQDLLLRLLLWFGFVKATLAVVVHLNKVTHGWRERVKTPTCRLHFCGTKPYIPPVSLGLRAKGQAPSAPLQACCCEP